MHLLIDAQALQTPGSRQRGIGRYSRGLIRGLAATRRAWHIELIQNGQLPPIDRAKVDGLPVRTFHPPLAAKANCWDHLEVNEQYYADWLLDCDADALLLCSIFEEEDAVVPWFGTLRPRCYAAILFDLIPFVYADVYLRHPATLAWYCRRFQQLLQTDELLAISEASAQDFRQLAAGCRPKVSNIRGATDRSFMPADARQRSQLHDQLQDRFALRGEFILYVAGLDYRKNITGAMHAYACLPQQLRQQYDLVLACGLVSTEQKWMDKLAAELGIAESLRLTGYVDEQTLRALYQTCRVFFFPSFYEGLGLPVLEALHCGAPVVASNASSIPEYAGPLSWLADPHDPQALARALEEALAEPRELRQEQRLGFARGFTWVDTASRAARVLETQARPLSPPQRTRLAWVCPVSSGVSPSEHTGSELINYLSEIFDVELIVSPTSDSASCPQVTRYRRVPVQELPARHQALPYDLFVYPVPVGMDTERLLPLMHRYPGLIVLQDHCPEICGCTELACEPGDATRARQPRADQPLSQGVSPEIRSVVDLADSIITDSCRSWQVLRRYTKVPVCYIPPLIVLPPKELDTQAQEGPRLATTERFTIAILARHGEAEDVDAVLTALAKLPKPLVDHCRLLLLGRGGEERWQVLAGRLGVRVSVLGVEQDLLEELPSVLQGVDVCVALRSPLDGISTTAIYRGLAAGAVYITNDPGWLDELPSELTFKVRNPPHEVEDLTLLLGELIQDRRRLASVQAAVAEYLSVRHAPERVLAQFAGMIQQTISMRRAEDRPWFDEIRRIVAEHSSGVSNSFLTHWASLRQHVLANCRRQDAPTPPLQVARTSQAA